MPVRKVFKYATGQPIPEGAIYLSTVTQTERESGNRAGGGKVWEKCWLVWHYFLVEVAEELESL